MFGRHTAHVALLDLDGNILAVNEAWNQFGQANGLRPGYVFERSNYVAVTQAAAEQSVDHDQSARQALTGLVGVLSDAVGQFSMVYPCHSPTERRWYRLWVESQQPKVPAVVVAHTFLSDMPPPGTANGRPPTLPA
ncbi:MAG TPA: hypothetical protein VK324_02395 [Tepidisphaeraceae bacterium]|nr:hypothetical protein [Tepidisphaeraceae bacterium]